MPNRLSAGAETALHDRSHWPDRVRRSRHADKRAGFDVIDSEAVNVDNLGDVLFQSALVLALFTDTSAMTFASWRKDSDYPGRLLGIGLPLTIAAVLFFTDLGIWEAAIIGVIIALPMPRSVRR